MKRALYLIFAGTFVLLPAATQVWAAGGSIRDAESSTHGTSDAQHQVVDTYRLPGVELVQINLPVLSHYSYVLTSGKEALIIDPDRDIGFYIEYIKNNGLAPKGVFLTHSHADFVAGHVELTRALTIPIFQSAESGAKYRIEPLVDGTEIRIGTAKIRAISTPGHTPDGMSGLVYAEGASEPGAVLSGDTLFVGSIGRPDLLEGRMTAAALAGMSYDSWRRKLSLLPDQTLVLPAHGAGSLCGAHLSDDPYSTIGREKASNPYLRHKNRSDFIAAVLDGLPEAPQYFQYNAALNREGPPPVDWQARLPRAKAGKEISGNSELWLIDLRDAASYAAGHVPNSVNIALRGRFETWIGTMVPWKAPLVVVGSESEIHEASLRLNRVGYSGQAVDFDLWSKAGLPTSISGMITAQELYRRMQSESSPLIVDVRLPSEWMGLRIGTVLNLPLSHLGGLSSKLDPALPIVAVCNSAYRSSMAVGILERKGFKHVSSLAGGSEAWINAGYPVFGNERRGAPAAAAVPKRRIPLADRIAPAELARMLQDLPGSFDLIDVRPAEAFADYTLPQAQNVDISELLSNDGYLVGAGPLVIIDRDGSIAMMAAGILSQKTTRQIKALHGGLEAYWRETELDRAVKAVPLDPSGIAARGVSPAAASPAAPPASQGSGTSNAPASPKKKSAGC